VINVLARLNAEPRPANVETRLQVLMLPTADTACGASICVRGARQSG